MISIVSFFVAFTCSTPTHAIAGICFCVLVHFSSHSGNILEALHLPFLPASGVGTNDSRN